MSETINDLRILAKQVRNASSQGENTAERVGHVMEGTLDLIEGASPDLSKYYTKQESDTLLLSKWTYDASRAASWDDASKDRHTHANKPALDLIVYDPVKNVWKFTGNAAFSGDVISYANLGDVDVPTIYEGLPIDNKTIKRDINGVLFAESTTGGSFDESSMWTALGTSISSKLIAQRYLNLAGYATEAYVTEKIQGLGAVFNLKGTKAAPSDLPTTGNKVGDVWYVASESVGYIWITDEKGVLRWEKFGEPVDLSAYYTKTETNALLANKWTTDTVLISQWNDAYTLRHSHSNKAIIDGITNVLINNWNSASADAHKHANKPALDLIEYDSVKNVWKFKGNAAFSGDVISYANLGDVNIPSIYEGLPIDNVTIKRNSAGALYSLSGSGGDFDKAAMWSALALSTVEQINKSHLADALSTYVLTTDSRLSDSRNANDVYAWAKQPNPPAVDLSNYVTLNTVQTISGQKTFTSDQTFASGAYFGMNKIGTLHYDGSITTTSIRFIEQAGKYAYIGRFGLDGSLLISIEGKTIDSGLVLGGSSGNLLYKGYRVLDASNWASIIDGRYVPLADPRIVQWGEAYNWGNHASAGYLKASSYTASDILSKLKTVDGTDSGLDADMLDGLHSFSFYERKGNANSGTSGAAGWREKLPILPGTYYGHENGVGDIALFNSDNSYGQILIDTFGCWFRHKDYRNATIADSTFIQLANVNGNVASATKLQTARSLWGQTFDGTGNVDGNLTASGKITSADASFDSFRTKGGIVAEGNTLQLGNIRLVVNPSAKTIRFEMLDGTPCNIVSTGDVIIYN